MQLLLDKGADTESRAENGRTPLSWAAAKARKELVRLLLEKGADIESRDRDGRTPLSWAVAERPTWHNRPREGEAVVHLLIEKGADIKSEDNQGRTPLWWATHIDDEDEDDEEYTGD